MPRPFFGKYPHFTNLFQFDLAKNGEIGAVFTKIWYKLLQSNDYFENTKII